MRADELRMNTFGDTMSFDIRDFGAITASEINDDQPPQTTAIQAAIDEAANQGGGQVLIPPGNWFTGTLWLKDHINLHLEAGDFYWAQTIQTTTPVTTR